MPSASFVIVSPVLRYTFYTLPRNAQNTSANSRNIHAHKCQRATIKLLIFHCRRDSPTSTLTVTFSSLFLNKKKRQHVTLWDNVIASHSHSLNRTFIHPVGPAGPSSTDWRLQLSFNLACRLCLQDKNGLIAEDVCRCELHRFLQCVTRLRTLL